MTPRTDSEKAYTIDEAAEVKSVSPGYIRAAIKSNGQPDSRGRVVVPLAAKRLGKGYRISAGALDAWFERLEDA